jgi:preprotein translocase subunit YajC
MTGFTPFLLVMIGMIVLSVFVSYKASQQQANESKNNIKVVQPAAIL